MEKKQNTSIVLVVAVVAVAILGILGFILLSSRRSPAVDTFTDTGTSTVVDENNTLDLERAEEGTYADGTYEAEGVYTSPAGNEEVSVEVTLSNGLITAMQFEGLAENQTSIRYQNMFAEEINNQVVGMSIDEVNLDKVAGSSLTSQGFNQAIEKIRQEASQS